MITPSEIPVDHELGLDGGAPEPAPAPRMRGRLRVWRSAPAHRLNQPSATERLPGWPDFAHWTCWVAAATVVTVLLYAADIVFHPLGPEVSAAWQKFASSAVFFGAAVLCVNRGRSSGAERLAWRLFASSLVLWGAASVYYFVLVIPSVADWIWLAGYLPAYAAVVVLLRHRAASASRGVWIDSLVGGLGVGGAGAALTFQIVLTQAHTTASSGAYFAFPVADLGLLALVVASLTIVGWRSRGVWQWITPALVIFALADSVYLIQVARGTYQIGHIVDLGWPTAALLIGFAAWWPEAPERPARRIGTTILVPAVSGLTALGLLVAQRFVWLNSLAVGLATASILVILIRLYLTGRDNLRLLAKSRREATTDPLTSLGNRRKLTADLTRQLADLDRRRPLMLMLLDLNGFKQYNDTFGHPAGDKLLERLAARLRGVVDARGTAYRMGGDEFCVLWRLSAPGLAQIATESVAAALYEVGEAFTVDSSYGWVLLPNETKNSEDALRMADRRMYAGKASGRTSAGRQSSDVLLRALDECDSELGMHVGEVAELAVAVAIRLNVPADDMEATRQTALLHDVGKVAIPDAILSKPGPLDKSEWAFMKQHSVIGERIINAAPALEQVARLVRSTHERHDGGGYPDGLKGDEIPLIAQIVSVCDAYDAMISERAYRDARDAPTAIAELRRCSGEQFAPDVVGALVDVVAGGARDPTDGLVTAR